MPAERFAIVRRTPACIVENVNQSSVSCQKAASFARRPAHLLLSLSLSRPLSSIASAGGNQLNLLRSLARLLIGSGDCYKINKAPLVRYGVWRARPANRRAQSAGRVRAKPTAQSRRIFGILSAGFAAAAAAAAFAIAAARVRAELVRRESEFFPRRPIMRGRPVKRCPLVRALVQTNPSEK